MGFQLAQVLSDRHHYSPFICTLCSNLCSIEHAIVTLCSHPFCQSCLQDHIGNSTELPACPCCRTSLAQPTQRQTEKIAGDDSQHAKRPYNATETMILSGASVCCQPLKKAQPLAYQSLGFVQVACIDRNRKQNCDWTGNYCDFSQHLKSCHDGEPSHPVVAVAEHEENEEVWSSPRPRMQLRPTPASPLFKNRVLLSGNRPSMAGMRSISDPSISTADQLHYIRAFEPEESDQLPTDDEDESILLSPLKPRKGLMQQIPQTPSTSMSPGKKSLGGSSQRSLAFEGLRSLTSPGIDEEADAHFQAQPNASPVRPVRPPLTPEPFRKSLSLSDVAKGQLYAEPNNGGGEGHLHRFFNESIASPPDNRKLTNGSTTTREAPPRTVQRTISDDGSLARPEDRKFTKISEHAKKKRKPHLSHEAGATSPDPEQLDASFTRSTGIDGNNQSINSLTGWNPNTSATEIPLPMDTLEEESEVDGDYELQFDPDSKNNSYSSKVYHQGNDPVAAANNTNNSNTSTTVASSTASAAESRRIFEKAEKLKKQANAKFNKGDFAASLALYTEGIVVMSAVKAISIEERELLSNMYSNRAVTFFREKKFESCIEDCDKALVFVPSYDKSWIRKWRALMALGNITAARDCLETASEAVPNSQRIREELEKCKGDKNLLDEIERLCDNGEFQKAGDMLKPFSRNADNIGLLLAAARVDAGVGATEQAMEKVNKALRLVPMHAEGLEIRGKVLFLMGETEKGAHLLQESYVRNKDKKSVRLDLIRCQKTHSAVTKGRSCVKRGRYYEAVDHFSTAIKECGDVPVNAPLYGILRTERAESFLLSKCYQEALRDCDDVLAGQNENATAYSVRAEILISMGKAEEAKTELERIRVSWGSDNPTIDEAYRRVDFELRVLKADSDLMHFVEDLENGRFDVSDVQKPRSLSRRHLGFKTKSRRSLEGDHASPVGRMRPDSVVRNGDRERRGEGILRVSRSKSKPRERSGDPNANRLGAVIEFNPNEDSATGVLMRSPSKRRSQSEKGDNDHLLLADRRRSGLERQGKSERRLVRPGLGRLGDSDRRLARPMLERQSDSERRIARPSLGRQGDSERRLNRPSLEKQGSRRPQGSRPKLIETPVTS